MTQLPLNLPTNITARANSNAAAEYLTAIRRTAFTAHNIDGIAPEPQISTPVAALKTTMVQLDTAWRERETEHQREVAALKVENQSLKARLNHEEWTSLEQILNEDLRSVRDENSKLRAQERNYVASKKRTDLKIRNDAAKTDALEKELKDVKERHISLKKELQQLLARHL